MAQSGNPSPDWAITTSRQLKSDGKHRPSVFIADKRRIASPGIEPVSNSSSNRTQSFFN